MTVVGCYSTVMECFGKGAFPCLSFDLKLTSQNLVSPVYSSYQQSLYNKITSLREKGMNFVQIANWLNTKGYKTPRGRFFRNNHVHSIVKKKRRRLKILKSKPTQSLSNIKLRYIKLSFKWGYSNLHSNVINVDNILVFSDLGLSYLHMF